MPEYNDATWFTMLFSCGVSTGLFFFGVAEPILHYTGKNRRVGVYVKVQFFPPPLLEIAFVPLF